MCRNSRVSRTSRRSFQDDGPELATESMELVAHRMGLIAPNGARKGETARRFEPGSTHPSRRFLATIVLQGDGSTNGQIDSPVFNRRSEMGLVCAPLVSLHFHLCAVSVARHLVPAPSQPHEHVIRCPATARRGSATTGLSLRRALLPACLGRRFSLGFYAFADYDQNVVGFVIDVIIDILYIVDVFVSWRTTYYDREGALIVDKKLARQRYLSTWFGPDVFASFPYEHLVNLCSLGVSSRGLAPPALKLPSLAKLLRIMRLGKKIDRLSSSKLFRITQFTGALLLAARALRRVAALEPAHRLRRQWRARRGCAPCVPCATCPCLSTAVPTRRMPTHPHAPHASHAPHAPHAPPRTPTHRTHPTHAPRAPSFCDLHAASSRLRVQTGTRACGFTSAPRRLPTTSRAWSTSQDRTGPPGSSARR